MSTEFTQPGGNPLDQGRREGYAIAALALSLVSFVNLLGAEKALLAIVLALAAIRGSASSSARQKGRIALAIAGVYIITMIVALIMLRDELGALLRLLAELG